MSKFKEFIKKVAQSISRVFKSLTTVAKKSVSLAVKIVDKIKEFDTNNPGVADFLTGLTKTKADDRALAAVRAKLPEIFIKLRLVDTTLGLPDHEIIIAGIKELQKLEGIERNMMLNNLAIWITDAAADGEITWDELAMLPKWYYDNLKEDDVDTDIEDADGDGIPDSQQ